MKDETKVKAFVAVSLASSKLAVAIHQGRFSKIEFILNNLKSELNGIRMSEIEIAEGGMIEDIERASDHEHIVKQ